MDPHHTTPQLGLAESDAHWYRRWEELGPPDAPIPLPTAAEAETLLVDRLGADPVDAAAAAAARPDPAEHPELWWVLERSYRQLSQDMGGVGMFIWPKLPDSFGAPGRFVYLWALLSVLPETLEYHRSRGIAEDISWATLSNLGEKLRLNRARFGEPGLMVAFWFTLHFRGALYQLGRLEFALEELAEGHPFVGHAAGELTLGIHIPGEGGPLEPQSCRDSVAAAREFFGKHFGDRLGPDVLYTCNSWLLDPQLADHLPEGSNIVAFQRQFELAPAAAQAAANGEKDVLLFVFNHVGPYLAADLPRDSTLRRILADGLADGVAWQVRCGSWRDR